MKAIKILMLALALLMVGADVQAGVDGVPPVWKPDGTQIAFVDKTQADQLRLIDTVTGQEQMVLTHGASIWSVEWHPIENKLAVGTAGDGIYVWDAANGTLLRQLFPPAPSYLPLFGSATYFVTWISGGNQLLATYDGTIESRVYDAVTYSLLSQPNVLFLDANSYGTSPDGQFFATAHSWVETHSTATLDTVHSFPRFTTFYSRAHAMEWSPDGNIIATGDTSGYVRLWDVSTQTIIAAFAANQFADNSMLRIYDTYRRRVLDIDFTSSGSEVRAVSGDGTVRAWNVASGTLLSDDTLGADLLWATFDPTGMEIATISMQGSQLAIGANPIANQAPMSNAGTDQTLNANTDGNALVNLQGVGSDTDGTIISYEWTNNGAVIATEANPQVTLSAGVHTLTLTVTDDDGATASDDVVVTVK